ncbi:hypothetical protein GAY28_20820, partial [Azospirillum brasilense]|nr:hypothetical protein [Azospirillum brasilense]
MLQSNVPDRLRPIIAGAAATAGLAMSFSTRGQGAGGPTAVPPPGGPVPRLHVPRHRLDRAHDQLPQQRDHRHLQEDPQVEAVGPN